MGKLDVFKVVFDHPQGVHFAGQWLRGSVMVTLSEAMKMRGITVNVVGKAKVHWHNYQGKNRKDYRSEEIYFDEDILLYGNGSESNSLAAGQYEYPFEFLLLADLPSSFEGEYGYVRYVARATIYRPWKFDHITKEAFTVLGALDLNREPNCWKEPYQMTDVKTVTCCCCESGTVEANITLNKRCFVPGETIFINGTVTNNSNTSISRAKCALKQYIQFTAASTGLFGPGNPHSKNVTSYEVKVEGEEVRAGQVDIWTNVPLVIPSLPPSRLDGCGIIDISYVLKFYVDVEYSSFKMETTIIVGTVPLAGMFSGAPTLPAVVTAQPTAPLLREYGDEACPPSYNSCLLPTYEECVMGKVAIRDEKDSEHVRGNLLWAPMYTMYQFSNPGTVQPMQIDEVEPY